ncbi:MAG TPA: NUDIX domain-containing protein [Crocinitomicaceae bacterium]|nr:NUDIX domain-containing protein [Crocinitomicaceae bacterium]
MQRFNIRCYALIINDQKEILLSDEHRFGKAFTKFVGGGLEFGEGTKECLERELLEELGLDTIIGDLFYVNDFYQQSVFNENDQMLSFYFWVKEIDYAKINVGNHLFPLTVDGEKFRWRKISELTPNDVTFPIDKVVVEKIVASNNT